MRNAIGLFLFLILFIRANGQDTTTLKLLFVGDIMQHDSNIAAAYQATEKRYDYTECFKFAAPLLRSADLTIGNLELTLAGSPYKGYPQFSAPDALAVALQDVGFDVLVTANNHSADRGRKGIERTIRILDSLQLKHTGTFIDSAARQQTYPLVIQRKGISLSLLNYTYGTNGLPIPKPNKVNLIDTAAMAIDLRKAREQKTDMVIVFLHWGAEYQSLPSAFQKQLATWCFQRGASLVIGAHPHVLQPMEWHKNENQLVAYSLGNFVSGQRPRYRDGGALLWIELQKIKSDSSNSTSILEAEYELEWMHKASVSNTFQMLPFRYFSSDTVVVNSRPGQDARALFQSDSRALLTKHNVNIDERVIEKEEAYFRLEWIPKISSDVEQVLFNNISVEEDPLIPGRYWAGDFLDEVVANEMANQVRSTFPEASIKVRKFVKR